MDGIEILQVIMNEAATKSYQGAYLWKYIIYEITSAIIVDYQEQNKNVTFKKKKSDQIPPASPEKIERTQRLLENLTMHDILFGLPSLRRLYKGRLEHTACDAYIQVLKEDKYMVLENDPGDYEEDTVFETKNLKLFSPVGVVGLYGQDSVDKDELVKFFFLNYVLPVEEAYHTTLPQDMMLACVQKLSMVLKQRQAFLAFYTDVLLRVKPKVVCYTHGEEIYSCFLREAAQKLGIPTVEIGHGAVIRNLVYPDSLAYSDYYLTYSDILTDNMRRRGLKNIYTVGKPSMNSDTEVPVFNENKPIVVSFISSMEKGFFAKAKSLAEKLDKEKFLIAYKTHPLEQWETGECEKLSEEMGNLVFIHGSVDVRDLFEKSDIVVGIRTSGILDALPYRHLKILVLEDEYEKMLLAGNVAEIFNELDEADDIRKVYSQKELLEEVAAYERGRTYRDKGNHYWPLDAKQRFIDFIQILLDGGRPSEKEFYAR